MQFTLKLWRKYRNYIEIQYQISIELIELIEFIVYWFIDLIEHIELFIAFIWNSINITDFMIMCPVN